MKYFIFIEFLIVFYEVQIYILVCVKSSLYIVTYLYITAPCREVETPPESSCFGIEFKLLKSDIFSIIFICIFHADVSPSTATIITELFEANIFLTIQ